MLGRSIDHDALCGDALTGSTSEVFQTVALTVLLPGRKGKEGGVMQ